jgi:Spy/CpxP family protein refolding chaperone
MPDYAATLAGKPCLLDQEQLLMKFPRLIVLAALSFSVFAQRPQGANGDRLQRMAQELNLTEDQKSQIKAILEEERPKMQALRDENKANRRETMEKAREIQRATNERIKPILTPEQQTKLDQIREDRREKMRSRRRG